MQLLRDKFPDCRQILVTTAIGAAALTEWPGVDDILVLPKRSHSFRTQLKQLRASLASLGVSRQAWVLQAHRSVRSSLIRLFLRRPAVVFREAPLAWGAQCVDRLAVWHEAHRIGLLLEPLGISRSEILRSRPSLTPQRFVDSWPWQQQLAAYKGPLLGVALGSVWGTKRWPAANYRELINALLSDNPQLGVVLLGSKGERQDCEAVMAALPKAAAVRVWNLAGTTTLADLRGIYPKLASLVSNDSSPLHYASAFGVPTVAIFGATVAAMGFGPLAAGSVVVELEDVPCRPCSDHGPQTCPLAHFKCMKNISVATVKSACAAVLESQPSIKD